MGWETRIFFGLGQDEHIRDVLSLEVPAVAKAVFPGISFDENNNVNRTDDYILLHDCPYAENIGLKARNVDQASGAYYKLLELKTVRAQSSEAPHSLFDWFKSSQYVHADIADRALLLKFLKGLPWQPLADKVLNCVQQQTQSQSLQLVRAEKHRHSFIWKSLDVEETDVLFSVMMDNYVNFTERDNNENNIKIRNNSIWLRSWSVEGSDDSDDIAYLEKVAIDWNQRFEAAVNAVKIGDKARPHMWITSFPGIILRISKLLHSVNGIKNTNVTTTVTSVPREPGVFVPNATTTNNCRIQPPYWGWWVLGAALIIIFVQHRRHRQLSAVYSLTVELERLAQNNDSSAKKMIN